MGYLGYLGSQGVGRHGELCCGCVSLVPGVTTVCLRDKVVISGLGYLVYLGLQEVGRHEELRCGVSGVMGYLGSQCV